MANFSLRHLRYFVASVENGGVAQASRQIHRSQPSISVAIKELEVTFGIQLFVRHRSSGMTLTPAGHRFYHHAVNLLRHSRSFESHIFEENNVVAGELSVAFFETIAPLYAPSLMASFLNKFPNVQMNLHVCSHHKLVDGLRTGMYDVAVCYRHELPDGIDHAALLPVRYPHAVVPPGHRIAKMKTVSLAEIAKEPLILLDIWPSNEFFLGTFTAAGVEPKLAYKAPSLELVRGMVAHNLGVSILTSEPVNHTTFDGLSVVTVEISDPMVAGAIGMAWHVRSEMTRVAREFFDHSKEMLSRDTSNAQTSRSNYGKSKNKG